MSSICCYDSLIKCWLSQFASISELRFLIHLKLYLNLFVIVWLCFCSFAFSTPTVAQEIDQPLTISERDILDTINALKTDQPTKAVELFQKRMPPQLTDQKFKDEVLSSQPKRLYELQIHDRELEMKFRALIKPVLKLYGRDEQYTLVIIRHEMPYVSLDAGVLLVISTGVFERTESDDEILGYIAHEVGHDYYTAYAVFTKQLFRVLQAGGKEPALARRFADVLALLELQCDAFSSITLAHLGYDPTAFIAGMERNAKTYKADPKTFHPSEVLRRQVIEGVIPQNYINPKKRIMSLLLREIKDDIRPKLVILKPALR